MADVLAENGAVIEDAGSRAEKFYDLLTHQVAERAKADLFFLAKFVLGREHLINHPESFDHHHRKLCNLLMRAWLTRNRKLLNTIVAVMMPRGTLKSTIVSEAFPIWILLNWPDTRILLDSEVINKPLGHLFVIKGHFESPYFRHLFGTRYDEKVRWNTEVLQVSRRIANKEPSVTCGAVDASMTGSHFDLIIPDDLVGETNSMNRPQILKAIRHANQYHSLIDLTSRGMIAHAGTRWAFEDVMDDLKKQNKQARNEMREEPVQFFEYSCWKKDAAGRDMKWKDVEFPNLLPLHVLADKRAKQTLMQFSGNYEMNPTSDETACFRNEWLRYHRKGPSDFAGSIYICVDPAGEGDKYGKSDNNVITVGAIDHRFDIYVLRVISGHFSTKEIVDHLYNLNEEYHPEKIGVETVFAQKNLWLYLKQQEGQIVNGRRRGALPLHQFKTSQKVKYNRIMALQPFAENGKLWLRDQGRDSVLQDQMLRYPKVPHDDELDCFAYMLEFMTVPVKDQPVEYWRKSDWAETFVPTVALPKLPTPMDVRAWLFVDRTKQALRAKGLMPAKEEERELEGAVA